MEAMTCCSVRVCSISPRAAIDDLFNTFIAYTWSIRTQHKHEQKQNKKSNTRMSSNKMKNEKLASDRTCFESFFRTSSTRPNPPLPISFSVAKSSGPTFFPAPPPFPFVLLLLFCWLSEPPLLLPVLGGRCPLPP
jgi:hypothetical protein